MTDLNMIITISFDLHEYYGRETEKLERTLRDIANRWN
jgi:hypothetical protein